MPRALIQASELRPLVDSSTVRVIDCRFTLGDPDAGRAQYQQGHVPGAEYAHLDRDLSGVVVTGRTGRHPLPNPSELASRFSEWGISEATHVVAYDDQAGAFAARLWWLLKWLGHDKASVLDGGFTAWVDGGHPVSTEAATIAPTEFVPQERAELVLEVDEIERIRDRDDHRLLDARGVARFRGDEEPIDPVAGHIPGARSLPFVELTHAGHFRPIADIRASFAARLGHVSAENAVAYCGSGVTACHLILAAEHAGLGRVRLYPGSWSEWIADASRPVEIGRGSIVPPERPSK